jgi:hypothetical protein
MNAMGTVESVEQYGVPSRILETQMSIWQLNTAD